MSAHAKPAAHAGHAHTHAAPAAPAVSDFAALLGGAVGQAAPAPAAAEPSLFDGLLAGTLASGKRRRLVICGQCGEPNCTFSRYVDE